MNNNNSIFSNYKFREKFPKNKKSSKKLKLKILRLTYEKKEKNCKLENLFSNFNV